MDADGKRILFEHYNDSCSICQEKVRQRDRLFAYLLITLILFLFIIYSPKNALSVFSQFISNKLGLSNLIELAFLDSVLWFIMLSLVIRYLQTVIAVERSYDYIHQLESKISSELKQKCFCREGNAYLDNYPVFLDWASLLFTKVLPGILFLIITSKILIELSLLNGKITLISTIDFLLYLAIVVSLVIYFISSRKKKSK